MRRPVGAISPPGNASGPLKVPIACSSNASVCPLGGEPAYLVDEVGQRTEVHRHPVAVSRAADERADRSADVGGWRDHRGNSIQFLRVERIEEPPRLPQQSHPLAPLLGHF